MTCLRTFLYQTLVSLACITSGCNYNKPTFEAPILQNIGNYSVPVTTQSPHAQTFFNQGIIMANGFNHAEAERSFREAVRLDSTCAMAHWGIAYVLGPNYNSASSMGSVEVIKNAVSKAVALSAQASGWEQALIQAIQVKFPADTVSIDAKGFVVAMKDAYTKFPDNAFIATLYAESVMNLHPWDFYETKGGTPRPWTPEVVALLDKVISLDPENPLANHLYLHATEASADLTKALVSAERMKTLVPSAGHLVHMPSHIYINTGDYHAGSLANEQAVVADSIYIAECKAQGYYPQMYYPHNYHFLAATAALEGRGARALEAAYKTASLVDKKYYHEPGYEMVQHYLTIPTHILIKFGQWEKILSLTEPTEDLVYPRAIWHYARGIAYANRAQTDKAKQELALLNELAQAPVIANQMNWGINKVTDVCRVSSKVLEAEIKVKEGHGNEAVPLLADAIEIEDRLNYNEPPDWFFSVRHILGNVLLTEGDYALAEKVFREDLIRWPRNGFALSGLSASLLAQGKTQDAEMVRKEFQEAWPYADTELQGSIVDPAKRKDLVLKMDATSPEMLVLLGAPICLPGSK
jgi:tetratricopeptide (TPR) repeat protein